MVDKYCGFVDIEDYVNIVMLWQAVLLHIW